MKFLKSKILTLAALLFAAGFAQAKTLNVVTTLPDLASIAQEVGGNSVKVESLGMGNQDPHFVEAKPSLIVKLMRADLFIQTGLELEVGWAPVLIQGSRNVRIQPGAPGFLDASAAVQPKEVPSNPSRSGGDVHPGGNPHYLADPENGRLVARFIAKKLAELDPADQAVFESNLKTFEGKLDGAEKKWAQDLQPYRGAKFISYHRIWIYFADRFGLIESGEIEPKPGIPPTASHTTEIIERMKAQNIRLIFTNPWFEGRTPQYMAQQTGAQVLVMSLLPQTLTEDYIGAVNNNVEKVRDALMKGQPKP